MIESIAKSLRNFLPAQSKKIYSPVGHCIYCGNTTGLTVEHVIPYGLGGRIELPESSCHECSKLTSAFEHTCLRTMYGPLRLLYDLPSRRRKKRPKTLPLKVKRTAKDQWSYIEVEQEKYPFLILFPYFSMPKILSKGVDLACKGAATNRFWIRGASPRYIFKDLLEQLVHELGVYSIMPEGKAQVSECCQMLAKIGHSFAVAELGVDSFRPFLIPHIIRSELSDCDKFIGGRERRKQSPANCMSYLSSRAQIMNLWLCESGYSQGRALLIFSGGWSNEITRMLTVPSMRRAKSVALSSSLFLLPVMANVMPLAAIT